MGKFLKYGRVVVLLAGRHAGRKAVIIKCNEDGNKEKKFGFALVAGIDKYPRKVTKKMSQKKILKRTNIKPFVKYVNLNHLMPTRYQITGEIDFKTLVTEEKLTGDKRKSMKKDLKLALQDKYRTLPPVKTGADKGAHLRFFYKKLKF